MTSTTRTGIGISWSASTRQHRRDSSYRVYLNDASTSETQGTTYSFAGLVCGRSYTVAVDAVDAVGNRSTRLALATQTKPCKLAARIAGVGVNAADQGRSCSSSCASTGRRRRGWRSSNAGSSSSAVGTSRAGHEHASADHSSDARAAGSYRLAISLANPDGGTLALPSAACSSHDQMTTPAHSSARGQGRRARLHLPRLSLGQVSALVGLVGGIVALVFIFKPGWKPQAPANVSKATIGGHEGLSARHLPALPAAAAAADRVEPHAGVPRPAAA